MSDGKRPGGLTALAVINFVLGALSAIGLLRLYSIVSELDADASWIWAMLLLALVTVVLMIMAGVGYLGQKRFLGRTIGNGYALLSLISAAIGVAVTEFDMNTLINIIYPLLTLALLNTTFKDDLVN